MEDQYLKAWREWVERDSLERIKRSERLERQEKLSRRWDMVRECREMMIEKYPDWQERRITEEEEKENSNYLRMKSRKGWEEEKLKRKGSKY